MPDRAAVPVTSSSAKTATGNSGALRTPVGSTSLAILVEVTASGGTTPSMTLSVEWSHNGTTFASSDPADQFTAITGSPTKVKRFDVKGDFFRVVWTITGTNPTFTFSATAYGI